VLRLCAI